MLLFIRYSKAFLAQDRLLAWQLTLDFTLNGSQVRIKGPCATYLGDVAPRQFSSHQLSSLLLLPIRPRVDWRCRLLLPALFSNSLTSCSKRVKHSPGLRILFSNTTALGNIYRELAWENSTWMLVLTPFGL